MASPETLDFAALIEPVPGDNPAGEKYLPQSIQDNLDEDRKEVEAEEGSPEEPKKADWKGVVRTATEALTGTSKSLLVAARLTEALVKIHGFAGLRDALRLMRELIEQCWDRLYPALSEPEEGESSEAAEERQRDDLDRRAGPFNWLDEADRGARFPNTIRMVPMFFGKEGNFGWLDWRQSVDGQGVTQDIFQQAVHVTPFEKCELELADLTEARDELIKLSQVLDEKLGSSSPSFTGMRQAVSECYTLLEEIVEKKRPAGGGEGDSTGGEGAPGEGGGPSGNGAPRAARSRAEAYRQLAEAANLLQQLEPHSPIPYLIQRAVELGSLPFPQLISQLIRSPDVLAELKRELGIKEE
jgi:type VI secretion system protein ImpA